MTRKANTIEFISRIKRDGSGTIKVDKSYMKLLYEINDTFSIKCLSISEQTFIANGFNSFVVKLKSTQNHPISKPMQA